MAQYTDRKDSFDVLWRSNCWANNAPGQPQTSESACNVDSAVRHCRRIAADLSSPYARKVTRLATRYTRATTGLTDHVASVYAYTSANTGMTSMRSGVHGAGDATCLPRLRTADGTNCTDFARFLPCGPSSTSNDSASPTTGRPVPTGKDLMWTKISCPPCAGSMNPNPRSSFHDGSLPPNRMQRTFANRFL